MSKLLRLRKRHERTMSIFHFVKHRLEKLQGQILQEIEERHENIHDLKSEIEQEEAATAALNQHYVQVSNHHGKIAAILE